LGLLNLVGEDFLANGGADALLDTILLDDVIMFGGIGSGAWVGIICGLVCSTESGCLPLVLLEGVLYVIISCFG